MIWRIWILLLTFPYVWPNWDQYQVLLNIVIKQRNWGFLTDEEKNNLWIRDSKILPITASETYQWPSCLYFIYYKWLQQIFKVHKIWKIYSINIWNSWDKHKQTQVLYFFLYCSWTTHRSQTIALQQPSATSFPEAPLLC